VHTIPRCLCLTLTLATVYLPVAKTAQVVTEPTHYSVKGVSSHARNISHGLPLAYTWQLSEEIHCSTHTNEPTVSSSSFNIQAN